MAKNFNTMNFSEVQQIWPGLEVLQFNGAPEDPPLLVAVRGARQAISVVEGVNLKAAEMITSILTENVSLRWQITIGVQPAGLTTADSLRILWNAQEAHSCRFQVRLISPKQLRHHWARHNLSLVECKDNIWMAWLGSAPSFGIGVSPDPYLNLWFRTEGRLYSQMVQFLEGMAAIGCPLTYELTQLPLLFPAQGTAEANAIWEAYENRFASSDNRDARKPMTLDSLVVEPDGGIQLISDEGEVKPPPLVAHPAHRDRFADEMSEICDRFFLVIVGRANLPPAAPLKPEWFGLKSFKDGLIKLKVQASIGLLDEDEQKILEQRRKVTSRLVELLAFSIADGHRLLPRSSKELLDREIASSNRAAAGYLEKIFRGFQQDREAAVESFLNSRRTKILKECENIYRNLNPPSSQIPSDLLDCVLSELRSRADKFLTGTIAADYSVQSFSFDIHSQKDSSQLWSQAARLLEEIYTTPRKLLVGQFVPRALSGTGITMQEYFEHLDALKCDSFFRDAELKIWDKQKFDKVRYVVPRSVSQRAQKELCAFEELKQKNLSRRAYAESLYSMICGRGVT